MPVHPNNKNLKGNPREGKRRKKKLKFWKPIKKMSLKIIQTTINMLLLLTMITHPIPNGDVPSNPYRKNLRKTRSTQIQRHWKIVQKSTWYFLQTLIKMFIITGIKKQSMDDLHEEEIYKKVWLGYSHDREIVNQKGNAFLIKQATITRRRLLIMKTYLSK